MSRLFEKLYVLFALVYFGGAFLPRDSAGDGDTQLLLLQSVVYLIAFGYMWRRWSLVARGTRAGIWIVALTALAIASAAWSSSPEFTARRGLVMMATTMFGVYFGTAFPRETQLRLLCAAFATMAVLSVGAAVLVPDYGVDHLYHEGDWCGVFVHKNVLGRLMVLGTLTFVLLPTNGLRGLLVRWSGALLCAAVLWMTGSKTALLMITLTLGALQFYRAVAARRWIIVGGAVSLAVLAAFLAWQDWQALLLWLGRDATLTGRIPLWGAAVTAIGHRPWVGYGFGGFWVGLKGPSLSVIDQVGWLAPHAHNGYLDLCLDLGIIGLVLFVIGLLVRLRSAMRECSIAVRDSFWPVLYLTFIVLYNIDESGLLRVNSLFCVLYAAVLASDGMQARPMIARYFQG